MKTLLAEHGCERLLSRAEVAAILRVTPKTITSWSKEGILHPVTLPRRIKALGYRPGDILTVLAHKA